MTDKKSIDTDCIHAGQEPDSSTGAVMTPIYATSTYVQKKPGEHLGFEYSRTQNPTRMAYEQCIAALEEGAKGFAFSSGMAAISTLTQLLKSGDEIIAGHDLYGGSYRLFETVAKQNGIHTHYVDMTETDNIQSYINDNTKMIYAETPSNPMLHCVDLSAIATLAKEQHIFSVCDNTFATPYNQKPFHHGFDVVVHSATKYLNGHSDMIGGVLVCRENNELTDKIAFLQNTVGAVAGPFDSFLALRGLKTLAIRMQRHNDNALEIAHWLEKHKAVEKVIYPGLKSHPQHKLAKKQMLGFSGIISFVSKQDIQNHLGQCELFALAESLGGVESLIEHPAIMTHASIPAEEREKLGINDRLIRLSIGIENCQDLIADIDNLLST